jgi:chromosome segregation ATPase
MATVIQELGEANRQLAANAETLAALTVERDALKASAADMVAKADAARVASEKQIAEITEKLTASESALIAERKGHEETRAALDVAQKKLANPAFVDASVKGEQKAIVAGGEASSVVPMTFEQAHKAYNAIPPTDAKARAAFREAHANELKLK